MSEIDFKPKLLQKTKVQRPQLYKVVLLNDDYTPREFVVLILKSEFRLDSAQAEVVMITAHQKGACVVSVYPKDVAETKAKREEYSNQTQDARYGDHCQVVRDTEGHYITKIMLLLPLNKFFNVKLTCYRDYFVSWYNA